MDPTNYYGSIGYDFDKARQDSYTARVEHDVNPFVTLRNQTRYNHAAREAVITAIQNPAAFDPLTNTVTLARQGNERENTMISNQTTGFAGLSVLAPPSTLGVASARREQVAPFWPVSDQGRRHLCSQPARSFMATPAHTGASTPARRHRLRLAFYPRTWDEMAVRGGPGEHYDGFHNHVRLHPDGRLEASE